jgi:uncharacterized protein YjlB
MSRATGILNQAAEVEAVTLADDGAIPNNPKLPVLFYHSALRPDGADATTRVQELFAHND